MIWKRSKKSETTTKDIQEFVFHKPGKETLFTLEKETSMYYIHKDNHGFSYGTHNNMSQKASSFKCVSKAALKCTVFAIYT